MMYTCTCRSKTYRFCVTEKFLKFVLKDSSHAVIHDLLIHAILYEYVLFCTLIHTMYKQGKAMLKGN